MKGNGGSSCTEEGIKKGKSWICRSRTELISINMYTSTISAIITYLINAVYKAQVGGCTTDCT